VSTYAYESAFHPSISQPTDPNIKIWRYMPLTKLVSMLDSRALHFARADMLSDTFEGSGSRATALVNPLYGLYDEKQRKALLRFDRRCAAINCWHMNEHESAAMWALYSSEGIAVQSTFARYTQALPKRIGEARARSIYVGTVKYIDYDRDHFAILNNSYTRFMHKRMSFAHERELRGIIMQVGTDNGTEWDEEVDAEKLGIRIVKPGIPVGGIRVAVDVNTLIEKIYVAPTMPAWSVRAVAAVVERFELSIPVQQSVLNEDPIL